MDTAEIVERTQDLTQALITARNDRPLLEKLMQDEMRDHPTPLTYMAVLYGALGNMTQAFGDAIRHIEEENHAPGSFDALRVQELLNRQARKKD